MSARREIRDERREVFAFEVARVFVVVKLQEPVEPMQVGLDGARAAVACAERGSKVFEQLLGILGRHGHGRGAIGRSGA